MMEDIVIIFSLLFCSGIMYYGITKLFNAPAFRENFSEPERNETCIASEDIVFINELKRFLKDGKSSYCTGSREEILSEEKTRNFDLIAVKDGAGPDDISPGYLHKRVQYYASQLMIEETDTVITLLHHRARVIDLYYRQNMQSIIQEMLDSGVLSKTE